MIRLLRLMLAAASLLVLCRPLVGQSLSRTLKAEGAATLAKAARERGDAVRGAILFPQRKVDCAGCHAAGPQMLGPDLSRMDAAATDEYLVEALLEPSKVIKQGFESVTLFMTSGKTLNGRVVDETATELTLRESTDNRRLITLAKDDIQARRSDAKSAMADNLVDQLKDRQEFLDLLKYLMEIKSSGSDVAGLSHGAGGGTVSVELQGMILLDDLSCLACHKATADRLIPPKKAPDLAWSGGRIDPAYVEQFIADPEGVKPGTTMPNVMNSMDLGTRRMAARALTHYVASLSNRRFEPQATDGEAAKRGQQLFHTVGCVACHSPRDEQGQETMASSSVALGNVQHKYNVSGLTEFLENPHAVRPSGRMPNMQLTHWEAIEIANYLVAVGSEESDSYDPFVLDTDLAEQGRELFATLRCASCHTTGAKADQQQPDYPALDRARPDQGCLSGHKGDWPYYQLDPSERDAIRAALTRAPSVLSTEQQIALTMTTFNCVACHQRGSLGGVAGERDEYFHTTDQNLGQQGRIPPRLTGVGAKLKAQWMRDVLVSGRNIRPYMKTRMPQYGVENVAHLIDLIQRIDQLPPVEFARVRDPKEIKKVGWEMAGRGGLNCVACHTYQLKKSETMSAADLTSMTERLKKDWFYHYLRDPQRFNPNTVMPTFWPGGRAFRQDLLAGDADQQIEALWLYLLDGRQARAPRGVIREPIELLVGNEAVMLRRSYQGIGKRGIGVGYPSQVNLAFDAEQLRLGMIWKGKFAETGAVWRGQGSGTVRPLGSNLVRFTTGPELDDAEQPWVVDEGRPPHHKFQGYYLDDLRRPTFVYRFDNIQVDDYPVDIKDESSGETRIRRTLTMTSDKGRQNVVFRVAAGERIEAEDNGMFRIGNSLQVRVLGEHSPEIVQTPDGKQLRIPFDVPPGKSALVLEYIW